MEDKEELDELYKLVMKAMKYQYEKDPIIKKKREKRMRYYKAHREEIIAKQKEYSKTYYKKNRDKINEATRLRNKQLRELK